jgi:hypothetical protein
MADIGTAVSYLTAVIELAQVKSVRKAMRANLIAAGGIEGPLGNIEMPKPLGPQTRESVVVPRHGVRQSPAVATSMPVPVVRTETVVERVPAVASVDRIEMLPPEPHRHREHGGPLVPPWQMPLVPDASVGPIVIKCPPPPPDVISKGQLLDFFM